MTRKKSIRAIRGRQQDTLHRPTALSLLSHIIKAALTSGMLFLFTAGVALLLLLDYNRIALDLPIILVFGPLILLVFVNGSGAWQKDWQSYHRKLSDKHQRDMGRSYSHNH